MIQKNLFFHYNLNFNHIFDLTINNNQQFINVIPEIFFYKKGIWNNNYRTDILKIDIADIPFDLRYFIDTIRDPQGFINLKLKIKIIEKNDNKIIIKTKLKLNGFFGKLIHNAINIYAIFELININNINTNINVIYIIKSILPNNLNDKINFHIHNKLENYFIKKIDNFFNNLYKE